MIRDTSGQDRPLSKPAVGRPWRRWLSGGALAIAVLAGIGYGVRGVLGAERSADRARIRIATVERGTLVRDIVADGRVVAANSPTLYAIAAGTVDFHVRAGDDLQPRAAEPADPGAGDDGRARGRRRPRRARRRARPRQCAADHRAGRG